MKKLNDVLREFDINELVSYDDMYDCDDNSIEVSYTSDDMYKLEFYDDNWLSIISHLESTAPVVFSDFVEVDNIDYYRSLFIPC